MGDYQRGTRVYVGNLIDTVKKEDLEDEFTKYGKLNSVWVALNPPGKDIFNDHEKLNRNSNKRHLLFHFRFRIR